jgi:ABC-type polysaccharide/polyol phosphate transport system ATPase subunit
MTIRLENVSKEYSFLGPRTASGSRFFPGWVSGKRCTFPAVDRVTLDIPKGHSVGLIGRNGSGKSTLLRLIAGIVHPSSGNVNVDGKLSTVLDVQSGLHPRLTGRQNIFLKGAICALDRKTTNARADAIIGFSGLEGFIDYPIHQYSSGMIIRLGFSIAMHMDFDILLLDEYLSVGDLVFQRLCLSRFRRFLAMGKTIVLASHNLDDIAALCGRVVLLRNGRVELDGDPEMVLKIYKEDSGKEQNRMTLHPQPFDPGTSRGTDTGTVVIEDVRFLDGSGNEKEVFRTGDPMSVSIRFHCRAPVTNPPFGVRFFRDDGLKVHEANTILANFYTGMLQGEAEIILEYSRIHLMEGNYFAMAGVWPDESRNPLADIPDDIRELPHPVRIENSGKEGAGIASSPFTWRLIVNGFEAEA